jgi:hypothetical protein
VVSKLTYKERPEACPTSNIRKARGFKIKNPPENTLKAHQEDVLFKKYYLGV